MPPIKPLYQLLLVLFTDNNELRNYLINYDYVNSIDLVANLPSPSVPQATYTMKAVEQIQAHGLDDAALFESLAKKFGGQRDTIEAKKRAYLDDKPAPPDPLEGRESQMPALDDESRRRLLVLEQVMAKQPTFLDVSWLAIGMRRARAVALLRMHLIDRWYTGTAFLVAPDLLLTAHHNVWYDGTLATAVEVVFDYERGAYGAIAEHSPIPLDPTTAFGDRGDDWALQRLPAPEQDRPVVPLATEPVSVKDRVSIIQHPKGEPKQIAIHHNLVTHADDRVVQYLTDTLPGSSGSPVFNQRWEAVAVHAAGGDLTVPDDGRTVFRNQGTNIARVRAGLAARGISL
jgi:hypothetical protein